MKRREVPIGLSCILTFMKLLFEKILLDEPLNFGGCVLCLAAFDNVADHLVRHRRMLHPRVGAILPASTIMSPVCQYDGILQGRTAHLHIPAILQAIFAILIILAILFVLFASDIIG